MTNTRSERPKNKLLASLPDADFERVKPYLRTTPIVMRQLFHPINEPLRDVMFLNGGVASITTMMENGTMVETATVGDEGFVGIEAFFGGTKSLGETMLQIPDTSAEFLAVDVFKAELGRRGALFEAAQRYSQAFMRLTMQSVACMAFHGVQERCARWLLMTHDRVHRDSFQLSQEFLAMMLGTTRPTVNVVAGTLQKAGLISYKHGHVTIGDREGLEASSCECYAVVKAQYDELNL
jgi:CRP-like cAMP-binding protein